MICIYSVDYDELSFRNKNGWYSSLADSLGQPRKYNVVLPTDEFIIEMVYVQNKETMSLR